MIAMDEECSSKLGLSVVGLSGRIPSARANFVAVSFQKSKMFILGGDNADKEYNDIWELDLRNKTWKKVRKELREPIVGHRSVKLRVLSKEAPIKDCGRGLLTYGGWQRNQYSDTLYLLDMYSLDLKECPRKPKSRFQEVKIPKSTIDTRKHVEKDLSIPEGRRDHAMCFQEDLNLVVLVGGWNALEWHPEQVELEIWLYTAGIFGSSQNGGGRRSPGPLNLRYLLIEEATQ